MISRLVCKLLNGSRVMCWRGICSFALTSLLLTSLVLTSYAHAEEPSDVGISVLVMEPYIELHTGPGRGYPVFHVVAGGDNIKILKRRTSWFLIETHNRHPVKGCARYKDMSLTATSVSENGEVIYASFPGYDRNNPTRWRWHISGGDFSGASAISTALAYRLTPNIALQVEGTQILGDFSDGKMVNASIQHHPFPAWRVSPYFQLGAGILQTQPSATLVQAEDRTDNTLLVGGGLNVFLGRRFNLFLDYRRHTVLTSRDDNEEIDEWKLGFNVSF